LHKQWTQSILCAISQVRRKRCALSNVDSFYSFLFVSLRKTVGRGGGEREERYAYTTSIVAQGSDIFRIEISAHVFASDKTITALWLFALFIRHVASFTSFVSISNVYVCVCVNYLQHLFRPGCCLFSACLLYTTYS